MKNILIILFTGITVNGFSQFTDKQVTLLTKINCGFTGAWVVEEIEFTETSDEEVDEERLVVSAKTIGQVEIPQLTFDLTHYNAPEDGDVVSIAVFEKKFSSKVKAYDWSEEGKTVIVETKSYIIVIVYSEEGSEFYNANVPVLIPELKAWFKTNSDSL